MQRKGVSGIPIVFVYPPASSAADESRRTHFGMCLGSAYLIAYLHREGFNAVQYRSRSTIGIHRCAKEILALNPRVVGFSVDNSNYNFSIQIARALKSYIPGIIILLGGMIPTIHAQTILSENPFIDLCARGESEETCLELLQLLEVSGYRRKHTPFDKIAGITYRHEDAVVTNPDRILVPNKGSPSGYLDRYPSPYMSGVIEEPGLGIITARGCNQHCVYCICPVMSKQRINTHSVERVISELEYISRCFYRKNSGLIDIFDDTFTLIPGRARDICKGIIENKINVSLACTTRADTVDEDLLDLMKAAGFNAIEFSLESAVPRILRTIGKVRDPNDSKDPHYRKEKEFIAKLVKYVKYAKHIGFANVYTSIMLGLPGETPEEAGQTIDLLNSISGYIDFYGHNTFRAHPGTPAFSQCQGQGIRLEQRPGKIHYKTLHAFDTTAFPPAPRSHIEFEGTNQDKDNIKSLALLSTASPQPEHQPNQQYSYFNKLILLSNIVTGELVSWLLDHLAINGTFIQVYSNKEAARRNDTANRDTLDKYMAPTNYYAGYYRGISNAGVPILVPLRTLRYGKRTGIIIPIPDTLNSLTETAPGIDPLHTVCMDTSSDDARSLCQLLVRISKETSANGLNKLFDRPLYPYFSSLCRWEGDSKIPNCRSLDTILVDKNGNVKTCWNGSPIGKVGMSFKKIKENLVQFHNQAGQRRCLYPAPLSIEEYNRMQSDHDTAGAAALLRSFDVFRSLDTHNSAYHGESL